MKFEEFTNEELMKLYHIAQEIHDGRHIKAIKEEMNRREREQ